MNLTGQLILSGDGCKEDKRLPNRHNNTEFMYIWVYFIERGRGTMMAAHLGGFGKMSPLKSWGFSRKMFNIKRKGQKINLKLK